MQRAVSLENIKQPSEVKETKQKKDTNGEKIKLATPTSKLHKLQLYFPTL